MKTQIKNHILCTTLAVLLTACCGDVHNKHCSSSCHKPDNVVFFKFDSSAIDEDGKKIVADQAKAIKEHGKKPVVTGHCSDEGSEAYNYGLGERRANATSKALQAHGCGCKPKTVSYGKSAHFSDCQEENRRAIIHHNGKVTGVEGKAARK